MSHHGGDGVKTLPLEFLISGFATFVLTTSAKNMPLRHSFENKKMGGALIENETLSETLY